ncbi:MAG: hypothetical protein K0S00_3886, partial [Xanthobacteraceae bacterium]|nr:hypothetical protein [Xanthobacteraceae bacterium]
MVGSVSALAQEIGRKAPQAPLVAAEGVV